MAKQTPPPYTPDSSPALATRLPHERLVELQEERAWLLKQIRRKRTELDNFISQMRDIASEIMQRGAESLQEMQALDAEIHGLFDQIFERKFGKRSRQQVEEVYRDLQLQGVISVNEAFMREYSGNRLFNGGFPAGFDVDEFNEAFAAAAGFEAEFDGAPGTGPAAEQTADPATSDRSEAGSRDRAFRQTFLRLATIYHPDRAEGSDEHARNTEIMKEINRAYKSGDFARLLELEQQGNDVLEEDSPDSDLERECRRLSRENEKLSDQYEGIKRELRQLRNNTEEGAMVTAYRRAERAGADLVGEMAEDAADEVAAMVEIRDFVRDFRDRKLTIKQFLQGPGPQSPEEMMAALEDMLGVTISFDPEMFR